MTAPVKDAMESAFIKLDKDASINNLVAMLAGALEPYVHEYAYDELLALLGSP